MKTSENILASKQKKKRKVEVQNDSPYFKKSKKTPDQDVINLSFDSQSGMQTNLLKQQNSTIDEAELNNSNLEADISINKSADSLDYYLDDPTKKNSQNFVSEPPIQESVIERNFESESERFSDENSKIDCSANYVKQLEELKKANAEKKRLIESEKNKTDILVAQEEEEKIKLERLVEAQKEENKKLDTEYATIKSINTKIENNIDKYRNTSQYIIRQRERSAVPHAVFNPSELPPFTEVEKTKTSVLEINDENLKDDSVISNTDELLSLRKKYFEKIQQLEKEVSLNIQLRLQKDSTLFNQFVVKQTEKNNEIDEEYQRIKANNEDLLKIIRQCDKISDTSMKRKIF